jgi:hypothetical protein
MKISKKEKSMDKFGAWNLRRPPFVDVNAVFSLIRAQSLISPHGGLIRENTVRKIFRLQS